MNNNKNRIRDRAKTNADMRKMRPKGNEDAGMINGRHTGVHHGGHEKSGRGM